MQQQDNHEYPFLDLVGLGGKSAADKGKDTRDYLAAAFPELNAWERAGADASSAGMVDAGFEIGRASCRERVEVSGVGVSLEKTGTRSVVGAVWGRGVVGV